MHKKTKLIIISCLLAFIWLAGCSNKSTETGEVAAVATPEPTDDGIFNTARHLMGFIVEDNGDMSTYLLMHGFLRTAENLGYPAILIRISSNYNAEDVAKQAYDAGCEGLLIADKDSKYSDIINACSNLGMHVVVPFYQSQSAKVSANVIADQNDYLEEVARGIGERMVERSLKAGRMLVYGWDTGHCLEIFSNTILIDYPQYSVVAFNRTSRDEQGAIDELAAFLLNNRDIKGLYCIDDDGSVLAIKAREKAQKDFRNATPVPSSKQKPTPSPTPTPSPDINATPDVMITPVPTPVPEALLKTITITAFGTGISDENLALFEDNDIYALVVEPYYEAAAQSTMLLDNLFRSQKVAVTSKINRPIVRIETVEKYKVIYDQAKEWFGLPLGSE